MILAVSRADGLTEVVKNRPESGGFDKVEETEDDLFAP